MAKVIGRGGDTCKQMFIVLFTSQYYFNQYYIRAFISAFFNLLK